MVGPDWQFRPALGETHGSGECYSGFQLKAQTEKWQTGKLSHPIFLSAIFLPARSFERRLSAVRQIEKISKRIGGAIKSHGALAWRLCQQMKPHKRQDLPDYFARGLTVMHEVKRVRSCVVIHE